MVLAHHGRRFDETARPRRRAARQVVHLDGRGHPVALVGGKAASLDALVRLGFRVPAAAAVTTVAYRSFLDSSPVLEHFLDELRGAPAPPPDQADDQRRRVDRAFLETPLPGPLRAELASVLGTVAPAGFPVAVRSSATAEDLDATSFAGQHLTMLEVQGFDAVVDALRLVWASLWHPAPRVYRTRMGVSDDDLGMAVVVQRMVPAERSGVCFTADPTAPGALRLEVVDGLGEALVSGQATPDVFQLSLPSLRPLDGTTIEPGLRLVARTALLIEEEMGGRPQDVEWSLVGDELWVLQSRPITTAAHLEGDGFDTDNRSGDHYAATGVSEMLPGVLPPLTWTVNAPLLEDAFRRLFARLGILPGDVAEQPFSVLGRFGGQAALDMTIVKAAARRMAGGNGAEVERQYLGQVVTESEEEARPPVRQRVRNLGASARALRLRKQVRLEAAAFERSVDEVLDVDLDLHGLRSSELLALRARIRDLAAAGFAAEVAVAVAAVASYRALEVALERWVGDKAPRWAQRLTRDAAGGDRGACGCAAALWNVFQGVSEHELLEQAIREAEPADAEQRLRDAGPAGAALVEGLWEALDRLGSAAVYAGPTWREQPEFVWNTLLGCLRSRIERGDRDPLEEARRGATEALVNLEGKLTRTWRWRLTRVLTGQIIDMRRRMLRKLVANARELLSLRESVKARVLALGGVERRATLVLAERLVRRGALRSGEDVELLADWELEDLVTGDCTVSRDELERREQAVAQYRAAPPLPPLTDHRGLAVHLGRDSEGLSGWGASPGTHRGRVRVLREASEAVDLRPGDVLVAVSTDPSWTPLFLVAGAVVVERGGPLSHAAIVARELGLPAVLNAAGATEALKTGDLVEVDGTDGTVTVLPVETEPVHEEVLA